MARMRRGSGLNLVVPLIVFILIAVASTVLCVFFYMGKVKSDVKANQVQDTLDKFVKSGELDHFASSHGDKPSADSYAGWLDSEVKDLKKVIAGNDTTSIDAIKDSAKQTGGSSLLAYIDQLRSTNDSDQQMIAKLQDDLAGAQHKAAATEAEQRSLADKYNHASDEAQANYNTALDGYKVQIDKLNDNLNTMSQDRQQGLVDAQNDVKQKENVILQKDQEIQNLNRRIKELQPERGIRLPPVDTSTQPKGTVYDTDAKMVYIDRGQLQHVVPGMTFEVFDQSSNISKDLQGDLHGKATIEVVNVLPNASVCRIIRLAAHQNIIPGDLLANAVYDPNYRFKFMVFGDFDIDNTGVATQADKQRIKSVISQWGGVLVNDLSYDTDFLVLGQEPRVPDPLPPGTIDPEAIQRHTEEMEKFKEYQALQDTAHQDSIPILNQNRFLALVGYYKR